MNNHSKFKSISALAAALAVLVVLLFSASYTANHVNHSCYHQEDCPICATMAICNQNLKQIGEALAACLVGFMLLLLLAARKETLFVVYTNHTPVSRKIRMNN